MNENDVSYDSTTQSSEAASPLLGDEILQHDDSGEGDESAAPHDADKARAAEQELSELRAALFESSIKAELLMAGITKEHLEDGVTLCTLMCSTGKSPKEAAQDVIELYPHLKTVQHNIPQLAAEGGGKTDGFALIKSIFARK